MLVFLLLPWRDDCAASLRVQENRMRLREEARRQKLIEKKKEEVKTEIILKVRFATVLVVGVSVVRGASLTHRLGVAG
jgi:hypothetical protein